MSDIEREEFEQAVTDRWSDSYSFTRFGDEDYYDEVLEGMWRGWQASRQELEGEPVGTAKRCGYDRDITYCDFEADEVPIGTKLYTHPASRQAVSVPEWIKCSERMPTVNDADFDGYVWWARFNHVARTKQRIVVDGLEHLDDAFWMPTNLTLTQPQPPKQEQGHE